MFNKDLNYSIIKDINYLGIIKPNQKLFAGKYFLCHIGYSRYEEEPVYINPDDLSEPPKGWIDCDVPPYVTCQNVWINPKSISYITKYKDYIVVHCGVNTVIVNTCYIDKLK